MSDSSVLLSLQHLRTEFFSSRRQSVTAVEDVSFDILKGEILGLVGESGCGKSVTSLSIMGLLKDTTGRVTQGEAWLEGVDLLALSPSALRRLRGGQLSMIFQEPMSALNPSMRVDRQLVEAIRLHRSMSPRQAREHAFNMLKKVGIPEPATTLKSYPHQLSGGMSQRVMIAMALSCDPKLLIADEPTTALDVTIQAQILDLMRHLQKESGSSVLLITHDLGVVAQMCSRVLVMYAGQIVEEGLVEEIYEHPLHPYTAGLIASVPKLGSGVQELPGIPGSVPDLSQMPTGCRFAPRCRYATQRCRQEKPPLTILGGHRSCRCFRLEEKETAHE